MIESSCVEFHSRQRPIEAASSISRAADEIASSGSAFIPSESAFAGLSWTSRKIPSTPAASRARERLDEFRLAAAGFSFAARQLHGMGHVEDHRVSELAHDGKRAHIHHEILIAERAATLGENDFFVAGAGDFLRGVANSQGERN